jgi:hypothetical protein
MRDRRLREEAVEALRKRTKRSTGMAVFYFIGALFYGLMGYVHGGFTAKIGDKSVFLADRLLYLAAAVLWLCGGIQRIWISPLDRLLLLLAEDMLAQKQEPNQALVPTPASGTPAAGAPVAPDAGAAHL